MLQLCFVLLGLLWSNTMSIQTEDSERDICLPTPLPHVTNNSKSVLNLEEQCKKAFELSGISLFLRNSSGQMELIKSKYVDTKEREDPVEYFYKDLQLPANVGKFLLNISCLLDSCELNCNWNTAGFPNGVQYSTSVVLCSDSNDVICWNCTAYSLGNFTGCRGKTIPDSLDNFLIFMRVNVSLPGFWYIHNETFERIRIEKLDPPNITHYTFSWLSGEWSLEIQWKNPVPNYKHLKYEIKINDDVMVETSGLPEVKKLVPNIDQTRKYTVWMRVTADDGAPWSDWSQPVVMGPAEELQPEYSIIMILAIVLGLPMILLVFLLILCKLHRIIFPTIPKPHIRVKSLLETDDSVQTLPANYAEEVCIEEVTEMNEQA